MAFVSNMDCDVFSVRCLDVWTQENNDIVTKWKLCERDAGPCREDTRMWCSKQMHNLLLKLHGVAPVPSSQHLELTVLTNTLLFSLGSLKSPQSGQLITQGLLRALEVVGEQDPSTDILALWRVAIRAIGATGPLSALHQLFYAHWALWLFTGELDKLQLLLLCQTQEPIVSPSRHVLPVIQHFPCETEDNSSPLLAMAPKQLREVLLSCTGVAQGIAKMKEGVQSEALQMFEEAKSLPASRTLMAEIHTLMGICLAKQGRPQSALQSFRKALEVDFSCRSALYQSALLYKQLGNLPAETEALSILYTAVVSSAREERGPSWAPLVSHVTLLSNQGRELFLAVPEPLALQHLVAQTYLLGGRTSDAVDHYFDLLKSFQDMKHTVSGDTDLTLPRVPDIYLEAAFAMLKLQRCWDCVAVCEELLEKILNLIPDRLVLDSPVLHPSSIQRDEEKLNCALWAGAAFLLQGQAYSLLKVTNEAAAAFTRSLDLVVKVHVRCTDVGFTGFSMQTLQKLKSLVLASRGINSMDKGQEKAALQDFQLALQTCPGDGHLELWLLLALQKLGRRQEALSICRRSKTFTQMSDETNKSPGFLPIFLYLQSYLHDRLPITSNTLKKLEQILRQDVWAPKQS